MKNEDNASKKGRDLEDFTVDFLRLLSVELGFLPDKLRRMDSGTQFGKDIVWRFEVFYKGKYRSFYWVIEDKNYDLSKVPTQAIGHKLTQAHVSSLITPIDCWVAFLPKSKPDNMYSDLLDSNAQAFRFKAMSWSLDELIDQLIGCFPDLYLKLYDKVSPISGKQRQKILKKWKRKIIAESLNGLAIRESYIGQVNQKSSDKVGVTMKAGMAQGMHEDSLGILYSEGKQVVSQVTIANRSSIQKSQISNEIDDILKTLESNPEDSLAKLFIILGKIEGKDDLKHELARTYNNIAVAQNRLLHSEEAIEYFMKAIKTEQGFVIAATNLVSTYVLLAEYSKDEEIKNDLLKKASVIIDPLFDNLPTGFEINVLHSKLGLLKVRDGVKAVVAFLEDDVNSKYISILESNFSVMYLLGSMFLASGMVDEAMNYSRKAVNLKKDVENLLLRGRSYLVYALKYDAKHHDLSFEDIAPEFNKKVNVENALADFQEALQLVGADGDKDLIRDVTQFEQIAKLWLRIDVIKTDTEWPLSDNRYVAAVKAFRERKFELSYSLLKNTPDWSQLPPEEVWRLGRTFLYAGAVEISRELFTSIENIANERENVLYWIDKSVVEVLLQNKNQAIYSATRAKELAKNEKQKQIALSHRGALLLRYADEDGGDRVLENSFEFEKEFPQLNILTRFDFEKDKEKIIKTMRDRRQWVTDIRDKYLANPIPSYYLQKPFRQPYIDIWSSRDPQFPIEYTINSTEFKGELEKNYSRGDTFVFDYIALLTLSKLNMLYNLDRYCPKVRVSFSLFQKIQDELMQKENPDLRRLWDFLRKTSSVEIVRNVQKKKFQNKRFEDLLEDWLVDTFVLAKQKKSVLVTDDFRIYRLSKSEKIIPINTWHILQLALAKGEFDKTMYSKAIGALAECFYSFIGFDGDDLFQIIADNNFKISARSYHLINQVFSTSANPLSFTKTFIPFMQKLWLSGALSEDKVYWLSYITNICTDIGHELLRRKHSDLFGDISKDSGYIWNVAITSARRDDLELLKNELTKILKDQDLEIIKEKIIVKIDQTLSVRDKSILLN